MKKSTNLIIIDASGSMSSKVPEVVGGLKQLFSQIKEDAKKDKKKVKTTTIVLDFSSAGDSRVLVNSDTSDDLKESIADAYITRGMTALYDSIGKGFSLIPDKQDSVFINILTDGMENDSKELKYKDVKKLITDAKAKNWAVTFMGTTEESIKVAEGMGVTKGNTFAFSNSKAGVDLSMKKMRQARSVYYSATASVGASNVSMDSVSNLMDDQ